MLIGRRELQSGRQRIRGRDLAIFRDVPNDST
jgi:hypothetical protein